ncbi:MAG: ABC transporter substrate-binding protein [Actinomycetota bacterium]
MSPLTAGHGRFGRVPRTLVSIGIAATLVAGMAACSSGGSVAQSNSITVAVSSAPLSLDPAKNSNTADSQLVMDLAYEPLINLASDGSLTPGLATSWKYTDSTLTTFQLKLRSGVKFSDGQALTAQTVVDSIQHEKTANGPVAIYVNEIKDAKAIDAHTVQLDLVRSNPTIGLTLTQRFLIGSIVGPKGVANPDSLGTSTDGAGQYMLDPKQTVSNDHYTFVPNPYYYDKSAIHFKKFVVRVIANPQTALSALKSGQISYAGGAFSTATQAKSQGLVVNATASSWYSVFLFDRDGALAPALKDIRVRQALNYAIDRKSIVKALFGEYGTPGDEASIKGYEKDGFDPSYNDHYAYDPAKAKQLLAAAGYPDGFTLTIGGTAVFGDGVELAQAVASDWAKVGVTAKIQSYSTIGDLVGPWLGKQLSGTTGVYDAQPMYIFIGQGLAKDAGTFNPFQTEDPQLTSLINAAYGETDQSKLPAAWNAIQRRVVDLGWFVPVGSGDSLYYSVKKLKGVALSPTAFVPDPTRFHF